ncbi:hypothetical protein [Avibacterium paragallinarum]|uniref:hypothetical protein n=1 Tax=Avibacterium paragallinarum TaxID=728 RepID=UPI00300F7535
MTTRNPITLADIEIQLSVLAQMAKDPTENPRLLLSFLAERLAHTKRDIQKITQEMTALCGGKVGGGCGGNLTTTNTQENRQDRGGFPPPPKHQPKWSLSR